MEHKIKSFSKINVHLNVIKKLKSNFHRIETLVIFSDLYDLLYVKKVKVKRINSTFFLIINLFSYIKQGMSVYVIIT